ncbi:MAG: hypothetical protein H6920_05765 [Sphingomonadaceae bacterium]|nr:hypothetical protein [Sphingomonadaceae bacterium]MCP5393142.1 hypothetical protein [Sphingomonadaceae bacterium]
MRFGKMKLMGTVKLQELANSGRPGVAGAVAALHAELKVAVLPTASAFLELYPSAKVNGSEVEIAIDRENSLVATVDYDTGCMLIRTAGPRASLAKRRKGK